MPWKVTWPGSMLIVVYTGSAGGGARLAGPLVKEYQSRWPPGKPSASRTRELPSGSGGFDGEGVVEVGRLPGRRRRRRLGEGAAERSATKSASTRDGRVARLGGSGGSRRCAGRGGQRGPEQRLAVEHPPGGQRPQRQPVGAG